MPPGKIKLCNFYDSVRILPFSRLIWTDLDVSGTVAVIPRWSIHPQRVDCIPDYGSYRSEPLPKEKAKWDHKSRAGSYEIRCSVETKVPFDSPLEKGITDITEILASNGKMYVSAIFSALILEFLDWQWNKYESRAQYLYLIYLGN